MSMLVRSAPVKREADNFCSPEEVPDPEDIGRGGVFGCVPEGAVIGIEDHAAVIAPAVVSVLEVGSRKDHVLLFHFAIIGGLHAGDGNAGEK